MKQWPTAAHRWHFVLQDVSYRQSCHLWASSVRTLVHCAVMYSRLADLKSSSKVSLLFSWIIGAATDPSIVCCMLMCVQFYQNLKLCPYSGLIEKKLLCPTVHCCRGIVCAYVAAGPKRLGCPGQHEMPIELTSHLRWRHPFEAPSTVLSTH